MPHRHAPLVLLTLAPVAACSSRGPLEACTAEFGSITLTVHDARSAPMVGMSIWDTVIRTGLGFPIPQPLTAPAGTYVIFDDGFKDRIQPSGDSVRVTGSGSGSRFAAMFFLDVPAGCHVREVSGPDTVIALGNDSALFRLRQAPPTPPDLVRLLITNAVGLAQADSLLQSGEARWAVGTIRRADGGFNAPWHWHLDPPTVEFAEVTAEACQTTPQDIERDLDYWIEFGQACIFGVIEARER